MKKLIFIAIYTFLQSFAALAQKPVISGVSPGVGPVNTTVVISGSSLPAGADALVQFGAAQGTVLEATPGQIKASVPAGTSFSKITVTNKSTGLSAESRNPFLLSFGGASFDVAKFAPDFNAGFANYGLFDMCACDFNGDGLVDVVSTHENSTSLSAFRNTSTPAAMSFVKTAISLSAYSRNIICGDVDGDGRPDLIVSGNGTNYANRIFVLRNISTATTLSFSSPTPITLTRSGLAMLALHDLNGDGRPELVATNKSSNTVTILKNNSTLGAVQFIEPQEITFTGPNTSHGISIQDLDGDGKADLAVTPFYDKNIYLLRNTSSGSTISFAAATALTTTSDGIVNLVSADLTGDGKADLAAIDLFAHKLYVWTNNSSSGSLQFGSPSILATGTTPWGIVAGDLDGNGKTDLAVHHLESRSMAVYSNTSSNGTLQLNSSFVPTAEYGKHLAMVDLNGDAKPDLAYTGISGNNLRILQNKHQLVVRLSPSGTITLCPGQTVTLQATQALGVTYQWTRNGSPLASTDSYLTVSEAGDYKVSITSTIDGYTASAEIVRVVAGSGSGTAIAMEPITAVCVGGSTVLKATAISGATYIWNGPNSFTATTSTPTYTLTNVQPSAAGSYSVVVNSGDCQFTPAAQTLSVYQNPQPQITASATTFCAGTNVTLQAQAGFASYQWKLDGTNYGGAGATTASITTTTPGSYTIVVTNSAGCSAQSGAVTLTQIQPPAADFSAPASACLGVPVSFQNTSTFASGQNPRYRWTFGDGGISTEENPTHNFTLLGTFTVNLTISYANGSCSNTVSKTISIVHTPTVDLAAAGALSFCPGDSVLLQVTGDATSAQWSNGASGLELWAKDAGTYQAAILTSAGCVVEKSIAVTHLPQPGISISATATSINLGEEVVLTAGGGLQYEWQASNDLNDLYSHTVRIAPQATTTYTVKGWNAEGCSANAEITITVDRSLRIDPPKVFLPNVEGSWSIDSIHLYPELSLTIVNSLGRAIYTATGYDNSWNGTEGGRPLEAGVYYYIFKDGSGKVAKTGSITLLR